MYRGNEIGVGIASSYVKVSPETAYSLVQRADALKGFIGDSPSSFVDGKNAGLENLPPNVVTMRKAI